MAKGKFSAPRPSREEERQIETAFRQVTGEKKAPPQRRRKLEETAELPRIVQEEPLTVETPDYPEDIRFAEPALPLEDLSQELPEEAWEEEPSFLDSLLTFFENHRRAVLLGICAAALGLIVAIISVFFAGTGDPYDHRILSNVYVAGVNLGGMTKKEAVSAVKAAADQRYIREPMVIDLAGTELTLSPIEVSPKLDANSAVNAAYDYGRKGTNAEKEQAYLTSLSGIHVIGLKNHLDLDDKYIRQVLQDYASAAGNTLTQTKYGLEGTQPALSADKFDENAPCQTLVIHMGKPGIQFDAGAVYDMVIDAYDRYEFRVTVADVQSTREPDPLDLNSVYKEFYIAPVEASVDPDTYEPVPGSYGYGFDLESAKALVENAQFAEVLRIPMMYLPPENLNGSVLFLDILAQHQTAHTSGQNRNHNLQLACDAINGTTVDPGEIFSFNDLVGNPTAERGYKYAFSDTGELYSQTLGGGLNQLSSTLYYCALLSDLGILERESQSLPASYIDYGLDAAVRYGQQDLRFRNTTSYPIRIEAELSGGFVKVRILGTEQRSYYVKLESRIQNTYMPGTEYKDYDPGNEDGYQDGDVIRKGVSGFHIKTYKLTYDRETNERLSRVEEASSRYQPVDEIVARVTVPTTEPPTLPTEPDEETTEETEPTTETTEAPTTESSADPSTESSEESKEPGDSASEESQSGEDSSDPSPENQDPGAEG